jgi:hypothetical protein
VLSLSLVVALTRPRQRAFAPYGGEEKQFSSPKPRKTFHPQLLL